MKRVAAILILTGCLIVVPAIALAGRKRILSVVSSPVLRTNDPTGDGAYGASRGGGARKHNGIDLIVSLGEPIYSPISGRIVKTRPYADDHNFHGVRIYGKGKHEGMMVKIFYMKPVLTSSEVREGEQIGQAQAISTKYTPSMKDHIHIEVYLNNQRVDPTPYFL